MVRVFQVAVEVGTIGAALHQVAEGAGVAQAKAVGGFVAKASGVAQLGAVEAADAALILCLEGFRSARELAGARYAGFVD